MSTVDSAELAVDGPWEHRFVPANGARFHVALAGPDERDAPLVVLLHDVLTYWWAWRHQLPALAEAGYRVAAMDVRGTGGSDKPPHGYDAPTLATDVAGVIRSLGAGQAVLVGAGTGGQLAWATAALHGDAVRAVAALSCPHPLDVGPTTVRPAAARRLAYVQLPSVPERALTEGDLAARLLTGLSGGRGRPDAATVEAYTRALRVPFAAHSQLEQVRWLLRSRPRLDGRRYLAAFERARPLPTLQVHGDRDGVCTPAAAALHRSTAAALARPYRYELLRGVGHYVSDEAPERLTALLLDWLAETLV
ncbi:alpha/beta hydrolase [Cellulomonas sp. NTE-D12]|uniref:alpha/beta fold hydrolase n=1 Tax=Cellulomonas sp. NTE-D12 TaxID=2962632 RepID=UPI00308168C6|nr:alpha/beta hydrolase [Cellulomonas sp. NTE-D12]